MCYECCVFPLKKNVQALETNSKRKHCRQNPLQNTLLSAAFTKTLYESPSQNSITLVEFIFSSVFLLRPPWDLNGVKGNPTTERHFDGEPWHDEDNAEPPHRDRQLRFRRRVTTMMQVRSYSKFWTLIFDL